VLGQRDDLKKRMFGKKTQKMARPKGSVETCACRTCSRPSGPVCRRVARRVERVDPGRASEGGCIASRVLATSPWPRRDRPHRSVPMNLDVAPYYRAALAALRFLESRTPTDRRFGAEADATWAGFRGRLETTYRIDLMIRDADAQWPGAFGARTVFRLEGVAEDEAFGASFEGLDPVDAEELYRATIAQPSPRSVEDALRAIASAWGLPLAAFEVPNVGAAESLVVTGPSAVLALALVFEANPGSLDWSEQVVCVASRPSERQVAAAVAGLVPTRGAGKVVARGDDSSLPKGRTARLIASPDADADDLAFATEVAAGSRG